ncbi:MAG: HPF/RaiA family ribosome-associated protein, partial [Ilumatobacteraceae bacterium]
LLAMPEPPDVEATIEVGQQGMVTMMWPLTADEPAVSTRLRVRRGKIVEQWIGELHTSAGRLAAVPMNMSTSGAVSAAEHDFVWDMVDKLVSMRDELPSHVDVRVSGHPEQRGQDPIELRVTIALPGGAVRASARSGDVRSAALLVERRLTQALHRRAEQRFESHPQQPALRDAGAAKSRPERDIVRHKTVSPAPSTLEEAIFDLESLGYDFFLYVDLESDLDAVVTRAGDGSFSEHIDPPVASLASARETLDTGTDPFVFFRDEASNRGNVLYRRVDGNYGLIVPADH